MNIRKTNIDDLNELQRIFAYAREQMKLNGNPTQWGDSRPVEASIKKDILEGNNYVIEQAGKICGTFSFILGDDPTYEVIEDGSWLDDAPYGTIHKIASDGSANGIFEHCLEYCQTIIRNIRIDTHADNRIMQHMLEKNGFVRCGIIYVDDGTPRIAYQLKQN